VTIPARLSRQPAEAGFEPATAALAVEALADERLMDESRYVEQAVASRTARGQGPQRIMLELARLGVDPTLIASAVDAHAPAWADLAADLRRRRFGSAVRARRENGRGRYASCCTGVFAANKCALHLG